MSLGGRDDIYPAANAYVAPTPASGGRNRYAEIMANYQQAQPFSFFGYPQTYSGGFTANPSTYTGGFTPYQRLVTPQPALPVEEIPTAPTSGGRGGADREAPSAWSQMTPAERAAYYAANPTEGKIALAAQDYFGSNPFGFISKLTNPDAWYNYRLEKQGLDPESFAYGPPDPNFSSQAAAAARQEAAQAAVNAANLAGAGLLANPMSRDPAQAAQAQAAREQAAREAARQAESQAAQAAREQAGREAARQAESNAAAARAEAAAQAAAQNYSNEGRNYGGGGGGGYGGGGGGYSGAPSGGSDVGRSAPGSAHYAKGGHVSMMHLGGPDPAGPDDGYAALKDGEYVINDKSVKKYGIELMNLINSGKISKGKLRGLLEM